MRSTIARRSRSAIFRSAILAALTVLAFGLTLPATSYAQATTLTVCSSTCNYTSIAAAIAAASSDDTISVQFRAVDYESNIEVSKDLTIEGQGASSTTIDGGGSAGPTGGSPGPVFIIDSGVTATIQDMTVSNGYNSGDGGGIVNNGGALTIKDAAVSGNTSASNGGGIANDGALEIDNSTLSGNIASLYAGGILNSSGTLTITNSTFSDNQAAYVDGGAIYNLDTVTISFSTIAGNTGNGLYNAGTATVDNSIIGNNTGGDCAGNALTDEGANLDSDRSCVNLSTNNSFTTSSQLDLGPLTLNSPGTTKTMALLSGSPAIDAAPNCNGYDVNGNIVTVTTDQRGVSRPQPTGGACDIGAYELQTSTVTSGISTQIDYGLLTDASDTPTGGSVPMGSFIHDRATVTTTNASIPSGSSVTFNVFPVDSCGGSPSSSDTVSLHSTSPLSSESVESSGTSGVSAAGPLAVGSVAYEAVFNSGDPNSVPSATASCEKLAVQSPMAQPFYTLGSDTTTTYSCTLEGMTNNGGTCPTGQQEAMVNADTPYNFVIDIQVTNETDRVVTDYVQGTLAKGNNFSYTGVTTIPSSGCGNALIKNNGAVLWNGSGAHSPNAPGFTMNPGDVCDLQVTVAATFGSSSSGSQQEISGQWSVSQTELSPVTNQYVTVTSPDTGSLAVNVN